MNPTAGRTGPPRGGFTLATFLFLLGLGLGLTPIAHAAEELRGLWVDTFHPALRNETEARQLVNDARRGGFNALFVEVRKRGDAYYDSRFEPKASDVGPGFDPLQRLLGLAHDVTSGPRLEVHAWIVAFNIWNRQTVPPPQLDHPFRQHPEWLTRDHAGALWDGANYAFDPGHPDAQRHTFNVAMDLVSRYDIDGLHWDYIRYAGREWGYNEVAVQRFNTRFKRTGKPSPTDADWLQFRRDQVTALVRKVYLAAFALKPRLKLSAATITFAPGISSLDQWPTSAAYSDVLQDWRAWMQEGILDLNLPMVYFRQPEFPDAFTRWNIFIKDHQYRRRAAIGLGGYLNSVANSFLQINLARRPSPQGNSAAGVLAYSYATLALDLPTSDVLEALTQPSPTAANPPFAIPASPPSTPWKSSPDTGHLKGYVTRATDETAIDGATLTLCGPSESVLRTDGTGFFGAVDLPPGEYQVRATAPGFEPASADVTIHGPHIAHLEFPLSPANPAILADLKASAGARDAVISWTTPAPTLGWIELRPLAPCAAPRRLDSPEMGTRHSLHLDALQPDTDYEFMVFVDSSAPDLGSVAPAAPAPAAIASSESRTFRTAGSVVVDNPQARVTGGWSPSTSGTSKYGTDFRVANTVRATSVPSVATYEARLAAPGLYAVETWFPAGDGRTRRAPFEIVDALGARTVLVDQSAPGTGWRSLLPEASFLPDSTAVVRVRNNTDETTRTVAADAVRWRYLDLNDVASPDRLPAWWTTHFFGVTPVTPELDSDDDGFSNAEEHLVGTDPTDGSSLLRIRFVERTPGRWRVHFQPRLTSRTYHLHHRATIAEGEWETLDLTPQSDPATGGGYFDTLSGIGEHGLFRIGVSWPTP